MLARENRNNLSRLHASIIVIFSACLFVEIANATEEDSFSTFGHPDIQGIWIYNTATPFERAADIDSLVVDAETAYQIAATALAAYPEVNDPDVTNYSLPNPVQVGEEFRSSIVVYPENGLVPYT